MIKIQGVSKSFGTMAVLKNVTASIAQGEVVAIIGPSGSGKSTLLRCMNDLEKPTQGRVIVGDNDLSHKGTNINQVRQEIGMVFQHFNLFPHMTTLENITYAPLKLRGLSKDEALSRARALLKQVGLEDKENAYPHNLSGGQKQRAAIARALAMEPQVILFDEPTSALDPEMVKDVLNVIKALAHTGITMVIVTHEMGFAQEVADRVWFIDEGVLCEDTPSATFFQSPSTSRALTFLKNVL